MLIRDTCQSYVDPTFNPSKSLCRATSPFLLPLSQPDARSAAVLVDELHASCF